MLMWAKVCVRSKYSWWKDVRLMVKCIGSVEFIYDDGRTDFKAAIRWAKMFTKVNDAKYLPAGIPFPSCWSAYWLDASEVEERLLSGPCMRTRVPWSATAYGIKASWLQFVQGYMRLHALSETAMEIRFIIWILMSMPDES